MCKKCVFWGLLAALLLVVFQPPNASAARLHPKMWYQERWCARFFSQDNPTVSQTYDCLTDTYVIEFDYADHWYEAIGESLYYAIQTGKKPGIVLILEKPGDERYWTRLNTTIAEYRLPIKTWMINTP